MSGRMDTEDSNGCDNYESCLDASSSNGICSYTFTFAMDCKHLMACGKCELDGKECPVHKKKPTYPRYPPVRYPYYYPWDPYYYPVRYWTTSESNNHW